MHFTIAFILHSEFELITRTVPHNIRQLTESTDEDFDIVMVVDGFKEEEALKMLKAASSWGVDEVRFRKRNRNCATGDPSNNGHYHLLSDKTQYLVSFEGDVALFKHKKSLDVLKAFKGLFQRHPELVLATKMSDHACWKWKLRKVGPEIEPGIWSVNRVASHFLVYNMYNYRRIVKPKHDIFHEHKGEYYNYEDFLSHQFRYPLGYGIAYMDELPISVFHCDRKIAPDSEFYRRDLREKIKIFCDLEEQFRLSLQ